MMMSIFRKKDKAKKTDSAVSQKDLTRREGIKRDSNPGRRSRVNERILRDGPDADFVWYEEA